MQIDMRILEILSSKICHDLISPISAINNGIELIDDIGGDVVPEAMSLIGSSAGHAARRLRLFRVAYGQAGREANFPLRDMRLVAQQCFVGKKIKLDWQEDLEFPNFEDRKGALKVLINVLIMSEEILAFGGLIRLRRLSSDDTIGCVVEVTGRQAALCDSFREAIENTVAVEDLTPRTIQPYITGRFAESFGLNLSFALPEEDHLEISLQVPACIPCTT